MFRSGINKDSKKTSKMKGIVINIVNKFLTNINILIFLQNI